MALQDRRVQRTRAALLEAFNHLVLARRKRRIRVADVVAEANVGRSTFYEHFANADDLHLQALARPFGMLADAAAGQGDTQKLGFLLQHFWDNRAQARDTLTGPMHDKVVRMLAGQVEERLGDAAPALPVRLAALQLAQAALAPVRAWLLGEAPCTAAVLAESLCRSGAALRAALTPPRDSAPGLLRRDVSGE